MENELLYEENFEEINIDSELYDEDIVIDNPVSKYEGTAEERTQVFTDDILSALEENGYISRSTESGATTSSGSASIETTSSGATLEDIYTYMQDIDSHLEYISDHMYVTPSGHDINTPLNDYGLTEILLSGILLVLGCSCIFTLIKNNVFKIH